MRAPGAMRLLVLSSGAAGALAAFSSSSPHSVETMLKCKTEHSEECESLASGGSRNSFLVNRGLQDSVAEEAAASEFCPGSPEQRCRMQCPSVTCGEGDCAFRIGDCCNVVCKPQPSGKPEVASNIISKTGCPRHLTCDECLAEGSGCHGWLGHSCCDEESCLMAAAGDMHFYTSCDEWKEAHDLQHKCLGSFDNDPCGCLEAGCVAQEVGTGRTACFVEFQGAAGHLISLDECQAFERQVKGASILGHSVQSPGFCEGSPEQLCKMMCPPVKCGEDECAMRQGSCCDFYCAPTISVGKSGSLGGGGKCAGITSCQECLRNSSGCFGWQDSNACCATEDDCLNGVEGDIAFWTSCEEFKKASDKHEECMEVEDACECIESGCVAQETSPGSSMCFGGVQGAAGRQIFKQEACESGQLPQSHPPGDPWMHPPPDPDERRAQQQPIVE